MKTKLTLKESARLIELGIDPKLASERCLDFNGTFAYISGEEAESVVDTINREFYTEESSIFTLADLLSILPKEIKMGVTTFQLNIDYPLVNQVAARYLDPDDVDNDILGTMCDELIDALYYLLIDVIKCGKQ